MIALTLSFLLAVPVVSPTARVSPVIVSGETQAHVSSRAPDSLPTSSIFFASGVDTLTPKQVERLRYLSKWGAGRKFHVKGYSDTTGSEKANKEVAVRRAKAVADLLPGATYEGVGETSSFGRNANNRRAVIRGR